MAKEPYPLPSFIEHELTWLTIFVQIAPYFNNKIYYIRLYKFIVW
jgi:hypothetical protein